MRRNLRPQFLDPDHRERGAIAADPYSITNRPLGSLGVPAEPECLFPGLRISDARVTDLDRVGRPSIGAPGAEVTTMEAFNDRFAEGIATPPVSR